VTTEHNQARQHVAETLRAVSALKLPTLWFWPNPDAGSDGTSNAIRSFREQTRSEHLHFFRNMAPTDFLRLIYNSRCLVGNSSVGIREASFLGVPVVNIGSRQAGRDRGRNVLDVGYGADEIRGAIDKHLSSKRPEPDTVYGDARAGERIAELLTRVKPSIEKRLMY
jgi:UDP-N-acetylglucosamine 2-epimerase